MLFNTCFIALYSQTHSRQLLYHMLNHTLSPSNTSLISLHSHTLCPTGLGHVEDLAVAMANVIGKEVAKGKIYNIQDTNSATFEGLAKLCATGRCPSLVLYLYINPS